MTLQNINDYIKKLRSATRLDPVRDWIFMLTVSIVILSTIVVWNAWAFDKVTSGGVIGSSATSTTPVFSRDSVNEMNNVFKERGLEYAKYKTGVYHFSDPSQ